MRLGANEINVKPDTIANKIYGQDKISKRHRHRYEFNTKYLEAAATDGEEEASGEASGDDEGEETARDMEADEEKEAEKEEDAELDPAEG